MSGFWTWIRAWFQLDLITKVQKETVKACGFLPAITTVSAIIGVANPQITTALTIAASICAALKSPSQSLYGVGGKPTVSGVPIEGEWVK